MVLGHVVWKRASHAPKGNFKISFSKLLCECLDKSSHEREEIILTQSLEGIKFKWYRLENLFKSTPKYEYRWLTFTCNTSCKLVPGVNLGIMYGKEWNWPFYDTSIASCFKNIRTEHETWSFYTTMSFYTTTHGTCSICLWLILQSLLQLESEYTYEIMIIMILWL